MNLNYAVPANILKRILAFVVDILLVELVILFPLNNILRKMFMQTGYGSISEAYAIASSQQYNSLFLFVSAVSGVVALVYFAVLEYKLGQTVGKIMFNLKVVSTKGRITIWRALVRSLFVIPFVPFSYLWIIDPLFYLFNKKQRFSEHISNTAVVEG